MKLYDQHVHCYYSVDSDETIENYLKIVSKENLDFFVTTDHCDFDLRTKENDWFFDVKKQHKELETLSKLYPNIKFLYGIEIGYKETTKSRIEKVLSEFSFDLINLSIHDNEGIDFYYEEELEKVGPRKFMELCYNLMLKAVKNFNNYDVLSHIDYTFKTLYIHDNNEKLENYKDLIVPVLKEVIKNNKALEINTKVQKYINDEHTIYLLNLYKNLGGKDLTLSSDAHSAKRLMDGFDHYKKLIKQCGFSKLCYFVKREKFYLDL